MTINSLPMPASGSAASPARWSVFAGTDVCHQGGLGLPEGTRRVMFDDDGWDFTNVIGLPVQMSLAQRRFDFTAITDARWRLVAKELIFALLVPRHEAVALLPRAYRTALHINTAGARLLELTRFLGWLSERGVASLQDIQTVRCEEYLAHRRYMRDEHDIVVGERSPATRRAAAQVVVDLVNYRELFTADQPRAGLRPWAGATASAIAEMPNGRTQNKTPPLESDVLRPLLAAAGYLTETLGPHAIELSRQVKDADRKWSVKSGDHTFATRLPTARFTELLERYERDAQPLPLLADHHERDRQVAGWAPHDPLTPIALGLLARQCGFTRFCPEWIPPLREAIEATLRIVGAAKPFARNAVNVPRPGGQGEIAWTPPLDRAQAIALVGIVRTAAITVVAAVSGMRSSELMELRVGCRLPPEEFGPAMVRHRLAGRVVKGQPLGGTTDEWVVIEPVAKAVELAEHLHDDPHDGALLFGRIAFDIRYKWLRNWVNGPAGQRLGLAAIPDVPVNLRALRRTLAIELAYRPGGVLAAKYHLKHVAVATTEGYASRPGGAQGELLAEVNKHESQRNVDLVWAELRNYQHGIMPAGPGARDLIEFFAHIDTKLTPGDAPAPPVQHHDRQILSLITKRARTLHLAAANYCWFADPSRALCLKLADTPNAIKPLAGMCDSTRCPQATHHPCHRPVWAEHAEKTKTFLGELGPTRKTEKTRLTGEHERAQRVLAQIDATTITGDTT
jgi:integrase